MEIRRRVLGEMSKAVKLPKFQVIYLKSGRSPCLDRGVQGHFAERAAGVSPTLAASWELGGCLSRRGRRGWAWPRALGEVGTLCEVIRSARLRNAACFTWGSRFVSSP